MDLTFKKLRDTSISRSSRWHGCEGWNLSDWGIAMVGEAGETCNAIKKLNREREGMVGNSESIKQLQDNLGEEIADTLIYLDLLAEYAGIDLEKVVTDKFNKVSVKLGFPERLGNEMENLTTDYLKQIWDFMGSDDEKYFGTNYMFKNISFTVEDGGHTVNNLFMDDVYFELLRRGEKEYVAI